MKSHLLIRSRGFVWSLFIPAWSFGVILIGKNKAPHQPFISPTNWKQNSSNISLNATLMRVVDATRRFSRIHLEGSCVATTVSIQLAPSLGTGTERSNALWTITSRCMISPSLPRSLPPVRLSLLLFHFFQIDKNTADHPDSSIKSAALFQGFFP